MSRFAEVVVLARDAEDVMKPLTERDERRPWTGVFVDIGHGMFGGWAIEFVRRSRWAGLLGHLESLPWPSPHTVQVLIHDEEDDCFGLWMIHDEQACGSAPAAHPAGLLDQSLHRGGRSGLPRDSGPHGRAVRWGRGRMSRGHARRPPTVMGQGFSGSFVLSLELCTQVRR